MIGAPEIYTCNYGGGMGTDSPLIFNGIALKNLAPTERNPSFTQAPGHYM